MIPAVHSAFSQETAKSKPINSIENGDPAATLCFMSNVMHATEILKRTKALAKADHNVEMMDCVAVLHGYVELSAFRPEDANRRKQVDEAIGRLLKAATKYPQWNQNLLELLKFKPTRI